MALKQKTVWVCTSCGAESVKWMGRCPSCGEWNTMVEEKVITGKSTSGRMNAVPGSSHRPMPLSEVDTTQDSRISLNNAEVDRILGGGIVEGSLVLIGGEPGIGKSTLSLQIPLHCKGLRTLYVTGEESVRQVKLRSVRLGGDDSGCIIYSETLMENILAEAKKAADGRPVIFWLGGTIPNAFCRTAEELRAGVYLAVLHDIAGVIFHMGHGYLPENRSRLWSLISGIQAEVQEFHSDYRNGKAFPDFVLEASPNLAYAARKTPDGVMLIVVNLSGGENRFSLKTKNGIIDGVLTPYEPQVRHLKF